MSINLKHEFYKQICIKCVWNEMSTKVTLSLRQGKIFGEEINLPSGNKYYKFFGIPYAKPPIGELRFKSPQPLEKFPEELLDCTKEQSSSLQYNDITNQIEGSEDCLYLNVRTPQISNVNKLPVVVWIHGGSFMVGWGNRYMLYPKYLIEENIIFVTFNYRVGVFGFLSIPGGGISGNYGLKDQQLALKWVSDNIHEFGGDSSNITIFGYSAGGISVHLHLLSAQSRKFFHKVICHSGFATMDFILQKNSEEKAIKLAEIIGFKGSPIETAIFFRNIKDPTKIFMNMHKILTENEQKHNLKYPFGPVIENENCPDAFITNLPENLLKLKNSIENIPIIMGYNSKEGIMVLACATKDIDNINSDHLVNLFADTIYETDNVEKKHFIVERIRNFYFNGEEIKNENIGELCELLGDVFFVNEFYKVAELHAKYQNSSPIFFFKFSYDGKLNYFKSFYEMKNVKGACHGDELCYLFYPNKETEHIEPDESDLEIVKNMCKLWTNFIKFGNPTPQKGICEFDFVWNPITNGKDSNLNCLDINKEISIKISPDNDRIEFWKSLNLMILDDKKNEMMMRCKKKNELN